LAKQEETIMEKIWLQSYPAGVPAEIDIEHISSLVDLFEESCRKYADKVAYVSMGREMTYRELDSQSRDFAGWLQSQGVEEGRPGCLMMPNLLQYPVALFGTLRAGCMPWSIAIRCTRRANWNISSRIPARRRLSSSRILPTSCSRSIAQTAIKQVIVTPMGEMLGGLKGMLVNFVVRHVKKLVPAWSLPQSISFTSGAGRWSPPRHGERQPEPR
jgi:long-chain acyl-CoA synthetase